MISWWRQRKERKKYKKTRDRTRLPKNFAQKIMLFEIKCQKTDCAKGDIETLMNLFTQAIEHYNVRADFENQRYFQMRLSSFLKKDHVNNILNEMEGWKKDIVPQRSD